MLGNRRDEASISAGPSFPQIPLGLSVQMLINGTWTDITPYVYARSDIRSPGGGLTRPSRSTRPTAR